MRLLITGVLGFAGRHLALAAAARGHEVVGSGLTDRPDADAPPLAGYLRADITRLGDVEALLEQSRADAVAHLAGQASAAASFGDPIGAFAANAGGTVHLLEAARRAAFKGPLLVVTSSEAYGRIPLGRPADESTPLRPTSPYGVSKASADLAAQSYAQAYGLHVMRARAFSHTGPRQSPVFVAAAWAEQIAAAEARHEAGERGPFVVRVGNLDPVRDLGDVADVVEAYVELIEKGRAGEAYNVCTGQGLKLRNLLEAMRNLARVPLGTEADPARQRPHDIPYLVGDRRKITVEIGWKPTHPLAATLETLLGYWRARAAESRPAAERAG
jgi:GDP-4-dehydro-6-deoxy-D-mannose reductase